jgi:hypothetical protein
MVRNASAAFAIKRVLRSGIADECDALSRHEGGYHNADSQRASRVIGRNCVRDVDKKAWLKKPRATVQRGHIGIIAAV